MDEEHVVEDDSELTLNEIEKSMAIGVRDRERETNKKMESIFVHTEGAKDRHIARVSEIDKR